MYLKICSLLSLHMLSFVFLPSDCGFFSEKSLKNVRIFKILLLALSRANRGIHVRGINMESKCIIFQTITFIIYHKDHCKKKTVFCHYIFRIFTKFSFPISMISWIWQKVTNIDFRLSLITNSAKKIVNKISIVTSHFH